jgi:L-ribulose-5-phosphate 3-epimerase
LEPVHVDKYQPIIAASPFCFSGFDPWVAYACLSRAGVRSVEVPALAPSMGPKHGLTTFAPEAMDDADVRAFRDRLQDLGLTPITVAAMCHLDDTREIESLRRRIDFAQALGCRYVITDSTEQPDSGESWREVIEALREIADYASDRGVCLALETHAGPTRTGRLARKFLEEVGHPNVGFNYDTGNIVYYNDDVDPSEDIAEVADRVVHVHLKDTQGGREEWKFCALGEGRVNFQKILQRLRAAGFMGPYSLEIEGMAGEDLNREGCLRRVRKSLEHLRSIGLTL